MSAPPFDIFHCTYILGDDGGARHCLVGMEWRPAGWSVCLPLLILPCTIKSRSSLLAPAHPGFPGKKGRKTVVVAVWCTYILQAFYSHIAAQSLAK